MVITEFDGQS